MDQETWTWRQSLSGRACLFWCCCRRRTACACLCACPWDHRYGSPTSAASSSLHDRRTAAPPISRNQCRPDFRLGVGAGVDQASAGGRGHKCSRSRKKRVGDAYLEAEAAHLESGSAGFHPCLFRTTSSQKRVHTGAEGRGMAHGPSPRRKGRHSGSGTRAHTSSSMLTL